MIRPDQIPDEVVEAAVAMRDRGGSMSDIIRTALNTWPGVRVKAVLLADTILLPLPTEASDE